MKHTRVSIKTTNQGLYEFTDKVRDLVTTSNITEGMANIFIKHTSASLTIQENADYSAKRDLENWINRLVPESNQNFTHTSEGPDDMPSHIKAVLTSTSLLIPIINGKLELGTWQGIYLWEHRRSPHTRTVIISIFS